jgi:intracellular septation protein
MGNGNEAAASALADHYLGGLVSGGKIIADQAPIMLATVVAILATVLQVAYLMLRRRKVDGMLWVSLFVIVVFGGATIYLHDETLSSGSRPSCTGSLPPRCSSARSSSART